MLESSLSKIFATLDRFNTTSHHKQIGEFIRNYREFHSISQSTLAKTSKVSRQCISKIETANFTSIFRIWASLSKILNGLKITIDELIKYLESKQSPRTCLQSDKMPKIS